MDQPLDLSQRENEVAKRAEYNESMDVEEPICQYPNCSCPLKHITMLESPKQRQSPLQNDEHYGKSRVDLYDGNSTPYDYDNRGAKLPYMNDGSNMTFYHPKRRKIEIYKQKISRSSSDNSLSSYEESYGQLQEFRGYSPNGDLSYPSHEKSNEFFCKPRSSPPAICPPMTSHNDDIPNIDSMYPSVTDNENDYRTRSLSTSHMQRLPKKRQYARQYSTDTRSANHLSQTPMQSHARSYSQMPRSFSPKTQGTQHSPNGSKPATVSAPVSSHKNIISENQSTKSTKTDHKSIKADMIREIDNCPDTDDIPTFRKKLFDSLVNGAKNAKDQENPGGIRLTALDYLISKTLINSESKPFLSKDNHFHQIVNKRKSGKLSMLDIVELQVEIGLA